MHNGLFVTQTLSADSLMKIPNNLLNLLKFPALWEANSGQLLGKSKYRYTK